MTDSKAEQVDKYREAMRRDPNLLRREIRNARLKVNLNRQRGVESSAPLLKLAAMDLPPLVRAPGRRPVQANQAAPTVAPRPAGLQPVSGAKRRDILRARAQLTFAELLGREVSTKTKRLAITGLSPLTGSGGPLRDGTGAEPR